MRLFPYAICKNITKIAGLNDLFLIWVAITLKT